MRPTTTIAPTVIFGCGNLNRSDDGVGVVCARRLAAALAPQIEAGSVQVHDAGTNGFEIIYKARGAGDIIIIDACASGSDPGALFELPAEEVEIEADPGINLHAFRWEHALWLSRKLFAGKPVATRVYLVEAQTTELGLELSAPVAVAADLVVERVAARFRRPPSGESDASAEAASEVGAVAETIRARGGNLYFDRDLVDRYFAGREAVAVLHAGGGALTILPVHSGGLLLKQKNLRGDRVVQAIEVLRAADIDEAIFEVSWDEGAGALRAALCDRDDSR